MKTIIKLTTLSTALFLAQTAFAETANDVVNRLFAQGYTHFYVSANGSKVTGYSNGQKVEVYLDTTTGTVTREQVEQITREQYQTQSGHIETNDQNGYERDDNGTPEKSHRETESHSSGEGKASENDGNDHRENSMTETHSNDTDTGRESHKNDNAHEGDAENDNKDGDD